MLSAVSELFDDENFRNNLGKAGGLLALLSIALDITKKMSDETHAPKIQAYNRLSKYVLEITYDVLKDVNFENKPDKKMFDRIMGSFKDTSDKDEGKLENWNSFLPKHPIIMTFKQKITDSLPSITNATELIRRIDSELIRQADTDDDCKYFISWWEGQRRYRDLTKYLRYVESQVNDTFNIPNNKPLQQYFIHNRGTARY